MQMVDGTNQSMYDGTSIPVHQLIVMVEYKSSIRASIAFNHVGCKWFVWY